MALKTKLIVLLATGIIIGSIVTLAALDYKNNIDWQRTMYVLKRQLSNDKVLIEAVDYFAENPKKLPSSEGLVNTPQEKYTYSQDRVLRILLYKLALEEYSIQKWTKPIIEK